MIQLIILPMYTLVTVILAWFDSWRIREATGKHKNIKKWISWGLALVTGGVILYLFESFDRWQLYVLMIGIRMLFFDPFLNAFRGKYIDYVSPTTNSIVDLIENKLHISFWPQRGIGVMLILISFFFN